MNGILCIAFSVAALAGNMVANAQRKPVAPKPVVHKKVFMPQAYIGDSDFMGGVIKKDQLATLLRKGITARDSSGNRYKVAGFEFAYAEQMLYEDSLGNLLTMFDYNYEYCPGDTLSTAVSSSVLSRFKSGDTLYINRVTVMKPLQGGNTEIAAKGVKAVLTK
jgi:hypothetical protein